MIRTEASLEERQADMKERMTLLKCLASLTRIGTADELYQRVLKPRQQGTRKAELKRTVQSLAQATGITADELYLRLFLEPKTTATPTDEQTAAAAAAV